ncbi:MAG: helix-turn-helix transcriptional regulator [Actinomycetaceae bacterium]|nr:helix-turn-helix transcriptional regulator [Actinomycetaceae bacterium]
MTATKSCELPLTEIVAANIRAEAARQGYSQSSLARALGMSQTQVTLRWNGKREWRINELDEVAGLLGVPAAALLEKPEYARAPTHRGRGYLLPRLDSNQQPSD